MSTKKFLELPVTSSCTLGSSPVMVICDWWVGWSGLLQSCPTLCNPRPVPFWVLQEKQLQKDSPEHFFVAGMDKYFPTSFCWSLSVLLPYWEEISLHLQNLAYLYTDRRCIETLFWGQANYFYQPPSETTPEWERSFIDI